MRATRCRSGITNMGHYCRLCGRVRSNESFSGKGHRTHVCRRCMRMPRAQRDRIEQVEEIAGFMWQSNISPRNIERLAHLARSPIATVRQLAEVVLQVASIRPGRRKRIGFLAHHHPALLTHRVQLGLVEEYVFPQELDDDLNCDEELPWTDAERSGGRVRADTGRQAGGRSTGNQTRRWNIWRSADAGCASATGRRRAQPAQCPGRVSCRQNIATCRDSLCFACSRRTGPSHGRTIRARGDAFAGEAQGNPRRSRRTAAPIVGDAWQPLLSRSPERGQSSSQADPLCRPELCSTSLPGGARRGI